MGDTQWLIFALGIYVLAGYGFLRLQIWLAFKSLEHFPNLELEVMLAKIEANLIMRIALVALWPMILVAAGVTMFLQKRSS